MVYKVRLKTGFYETRPYDLYIEPGRLVLSSADDENGKVCIDAAALRSFTLINKKLPELEIQTLSAVYLATLKEQENLGDLFLLLKQYFDRPIVYLSR